MTNEEMLFAKLKGVIDITDVNPQVAMKTINTLFYEDNYTPRVYTWKKPVHPHTIICGPLSITFDCTYSVSMKYLNIDIELIQNSNMKYLHKLTTYTWDDKKGTH